MRLLITQMHSLLFVEKVDFTNIEIFSLLVSNSIHQKSEGESHKPPKKCPWPGWGSQAWFVPIVLTTTLLLVHQRICKIDII